MARDQHFQWILSFSPKKPLANRLKSQAANREGVDEMWIIDFPSLVFIIAAGLQLGALGLFGFDAAAAVFGAYTKAAYIVVGASAVWQLFRQRFH